MSGAERNNQPAGDAGPVSASSGARRDGSAATFALGGSGGGGSKNPPPRATPVRPPRRGGPAGTALLQRLRSVVRRRRGHGAPAEPAPRVGRTPGEGGWWPWAPAFGSYSVFLLSP